MVTLDVEPQEERNKAIYDHYSFNIFIKKSQEVYLDGTKIEVECYGKKLE